MKLAEISSDRFNDLVVSEPNVTFYQTSNWADYKSLDGLEPLFLGYVDEHDVYVAPHDVRPELFDRAADDGAAPDNGIGVVFQQ